jgi:hypothetical protein
MKLYLFLGILVLGALVTVWAPELDTAGAPEWFLFMHDAVTAFRDSLIRLFKFVFEIE